MEPEDYWDYMIAATVVVIAATCITYVSMVT